MIIWVNYCLLHFLNFLHSIFDLRLSVSIWYRRWQLGIILFQFANVCNRFPGGNNLVGEKLLYKTGFWFMEYEILEGLKNLNPVGGLWMGATIFADEILLQSHGRSFRLPFGTEWSSELAGQRRLPKGTTNFNDCETNG